MDNISTITAISGWALSRKWFTEEVASAFPGARVQIIYPETPERHEEAEILLCRYPADLYIGYSLGSLWLLKYGHLLPDTCIKALLAPILSFLEKDGLGGTTTETQLKYLSRSLKQGSDQCATVKSFFSLCDLPFSEKMIDDIPNRDILLRGLEFLKTCQATGKDAKNFLSILGENDIFINGGLLKSHIPNLDIIQGVGHAPGNLLKHLANRLNWKIRNP
ncbi:MAG: hypothetical protein H8E32_05440 [Nitrospinae bacterium]|nr:hypothetical protein [Nitrospinota bacterium]MBL7019018.1 hypothetical protein [Nitrospinaceae bacterium]